MRNLLSCTLIMLLLASMTSGCASKYGPQQTSVHYYPACYRPISTLRESEQRVASSTAGGAAIGAVGGALLGLLASGGEAKGALIGAVAGGAAGAVTGNIMGKHQKIADDNRRMASYLQDIEGNISGLDITSASARAALQCYDRQFRLLLKDIRARRVSRRQAEHMFAEIQSGTREAASLLGSAADNGRNLERQYRDALAQEERRLSAPAASRGTRSSASAAASRASLQKAQKRTSDLNRRVDRIADEQTAAQRQADAQSRELAEALASSQV